MRLTEVKDYVKNYKFLNIVIALAYVYFYDFIYCNYVCALFHETYIPLDVNDYILLGVTGSFPIFFYKGLKEIASVFSIFTYILAFIPFNETLAVGGFGSAYLDYRILFIVSMCIFFTTDSFSIKSNLFARKSKWSFLQFRRFVYLILVVVVLLNITNLHLTNFMNSRDVLYDLRANLKVVGGTPVVYLIYWLKNALLPILLVCALQRKEYLHVLFAFLGCLCMYMIDQQKITFLAPFAILMLFLLYKLNNIMLRNYYHIIIMLTLIIVPFLCFFYKDISDTAYEIAAILIYRTQCIEGQELNTYLNFFGHDGTHPYTYYSHIGIINALTGMYPYGNMALGHAVTEGGSNANGMFWLMDGIAAGGFYGCAFIGIVFVFVKSFFNGIKQKCDVELFAVISLFAMSMTMNVSLFTALLSCGLLLFYFLFLYVDFDLK